MSNLGTAAFRATPDIVATIIRLFDDGHSCSAIQAATGVSRGTVSKHLKREGRTPTRVKYSANHEFFQRIDSEQTAYWLGFMAADGHFSSNGTVQLGLASKDAQHVYRFRDVIQSNHPVHHRSSGGYERSYLHFYSPEMVRSVALFNMVGAKTFTLTWPTLPPELESHFIRGYFDGDGSITSLGWKSKFSIIGSESFIQTLQMVLASHCSLRITNLYRPSETQAVYVEYQGAIQLRRIYDYLYTDATVYLPRKKEKFSAVVGDQAAVCKPGTSSAA